MPCTDLAVRKHIALLGTKAPATLQELRELAAELPPSRGRAYLVSWSERFDYLAAFGEPVPGRLEIEAAWRRSGVETDSPSSGCGRTNSDICWQVFANFDPYCNRCLNRERLSHRPHASRRHRRDNGSRG